MGLLLETNFFFFFEWGDKKKFVPEHEINSNVDIVFYMNVILFHEIYPSKVLGKYSGMAHLQLRLGMD